MIQTQKNEQKINITKTEEKDIITRTTRIDNSQKILKCEQECTT